MDIEQLHLKLEENGLNDYFESIKSFVKKTIKLYPNKIIEENYEIGKSKIGGTPDLPNDIKWPFETFDKEQKLFFFTKKQERITKPLSFICQLNMNEISKFDDSNLLPKSGILYFFYSSEQNAWGFDIKDKNKFKIIYWNGDFKELKQQKQPEELIEYGYFKPTNINICNEISFPSFESEIYNQFSENDNDKFWDIIQETEINKMFGYADTIQNEMELECELVTNGLYCGDPSGYNDPLAKKLEPNSKDWILLLQIDSNSENEMMWGDSGRLYFWIKKQNLIEKKFDDAWFILQCY